MINYDTHVKPFSNKFVMIRIDAATQMKITEFVNSLVEIKNQESHHQIDNKSHFKRFYTGQLVNQIYIINRI